MKSQDNNEGEKTARSAEPVDFLIVTALLEERDAILERLGDYETIDEKGQPITYYRGHLALPGSDDRYEIVVTVPQGMGNLDTSVAAALAIERWDPVIAMVVGIAAGVRGRVELGHVVVGQFVHYYELAKIAPKWWRRRPHGPLSEERFQQLWCDHELYYHARVKDMAEWKGDLRQPIPGEPEAPWMPRAHFGPIASGEKVVVDSAFVKGIEKHCAKLLAVAMEGAGLAKAVRYFDRGKGFLEIRGISDYGDDRKNDDWHVFAADAAAAFAVGLLRSRPIEPRSVEAVRAASGKSTQPLLLLRAESLRQISSVEVLTGLPESLQERDISMISLDFTDLVQNKILRDPAEAVTRLVGPQSELLNSLSQHIDAELVFCGLAHIPLLVLAGHVVSDRRKVHLMDFHPSPGSESWAWPDPDGDYPALSVRGLPNQGSKKVGDAVIRMSVSYPVHSAQTETIVPDPVVAVDLAVPEVVRDVLKSEAQVRNYGRAFRQTLDRIAMDFPGVAKVHLFYAGPVSLAFHIGQQISENIHPPVIVWNYQRTYTWAIDLHAALAGDDAVIEAATTNH